MANLRNIPGIDEMLEQEEIKKLLSIYNRDFVLDKLRQAVDEKRQELLKSTEDREKQQLIYEVVEKLDNLIKLATTGTLQRVINGTGVVLHTNLGRAPLCTTAIKYMEEIAYNYNNLEMNMEAGLRGSRYHHVEDLLIELTGAQAALVVNNNAAAVMLGLSTLAKDKEVIVSRGQLIEIGGAFRIPDVMKQSGARLIEVGTTNKTYISDYENAISDETALLFSAHTSNYKIVGFSEEVSIEAMSSLGRAKGIPVLLDLGSGILTDLGNWGLRDEPTVQKSVESGADVITFSGDKLLGGPQAGIIIGKKEYIEAMKKNQLTRALRVDKLTIAALEGTLLEYLGGNPSESIPIIKMLTRSKEELAEKADNLYQVLSEEFMAHEKINKIQVVKTEDMVGGGAYPSYRIPGYGVEISYKNQLLEKVAKKMRLTNPALVCRRQEEKMLISVRTLLPGDERLIITVMKKALQ